MNFPDFSGDRPERGWFLQLLTGLKKLTFDENIDCVKIRVNIGTTETQVGHPLGRTPRYIIEVAAYPDGTAGIQFTRAPTNDKIWLTRTTAGNCTLLLF